MDYCLFQLWKKVTEKLDDYTYRQHQYKCRRETPIYVE